MLEKLELLTKLKPGLECNFQITQGLSKRSIFQSFIEENELLVQRDQDLRLSMTSRTENKVRSPKLVRQIHKETSKNILDIRDLPTNSCKKCDLVWIGESKSSCDLCKEKYPGIGIDIEIINNKRPRPPSKKIERYPTPKVDGEFKRTISPARIISPFPTEALNEIILKINGKEYTLKSNKFSLIMPKPNDALITENSCDLSFSDLLKQINTSVMREDRPLSIDVHSGSTTFKAPITPSFQNKKTEMIFGSTGGSDDILTEEAQTVPTEISFSESKSEIFSENPQANLLQKLKNYGTDAQADLNLLIHKQNYLSKKPQNFSECRDNTETLLNKHLEIFKKILPGVMEMIPEYGNIIERSIKSIVLLIDHIFVSYSVRLQKLSQETNHKQIENNVKQIENKYLSRISALTHLIQRYEEVILQCKRALRKDERNNGILLMIEDLGY